MARYKGTQASHLYEKSVHTLCTIHLLITTVTAWQSERMVRTQVTVIIMTLLTLLRYVHTFRNDGHIMTDIKQVLTPDRVNI